MAPEDEQPDDVQPGEALAAEGQPEAAAAWPIWRPQRKSSAEAAEPQASELALASEAEPENSSRPEGPLAARNAQLRHPPVGMLCQGC